MILFFSTVCSSFKGFKCVILQKLEDPKIAGNLSDPKNSGNVAKARKVATKFANPEK